MTSERRPSAVQFSGGGGAESVSPNTVAEVPVAGCQLAVSERGREIHRLTGDCELTEARRARAGSAPRRRSDHVARHAVCADQSAASEWFTGNKQCLYVVR